MKAMHLELKFVPSSRSSLKNAKGQPWLPPDQFASTGHAEDDEPVSTSWNTIGGLSRTQFSTQVNRWNPI